MPVIQINERLRYGFMPQPDPALIQKPALLIVWAQDADGGLKSLSSCIGQAEKIGTLNRSYGTVVIETFALYRVANVTINPPVYDRKSDPSRCP